MHCIPQRIQQRGVLGRNRRRQLPDVALGNDGVARERPVRIHAQNPHVLADVRLADAALHALAAGHVHLRRNQVALFHRSHAATHSGHSARELVARNQRRMDAPLRPWVPVEDMQVGPANAGSLHPHQHLAGAGRRNRNLAQLDAGRSVSFYYRLHGGRHIAGNPPRFSKQLSLSTRQPPPQRRQLHPPRRRQPRRPRPRRPRLHRVMPTVP